MAIINSFKFIKEAKRTLSFQALIDEYFRPQLMNKIGKSMTETIEKMNQTTIMPNPFEIKFQLPDSDLWESAYRFYHDEVEAIKAALEYSKIHRIYHTVGVFSNDFIVTKISNGEPFCIYKGHEQEVLAALGTDAQNQMINPTYEQQEDSENHDPVEYLIFSKPWNSNWDPVELTYRNLKDAVVIAEKYAINCMTAVRHMDGEDVVKFGSGGRKPYFINPDFRNQVDAVLKDSENQSVGFAGVISGDFYLGHSGYIRATSKDVSLLEIGKTIKFGLQNESYTIIEILRHDNPLGILLDHPLERIIYNNFKINSCGSPSGRLVSMIEFPEPIQCNAGEEISFAVTFKFCPDCKDGFYYPFVGPKEPCRTCNGGN